MSTCIRTVWVKMLPIKIVDMLRILSYGLPDPGHRVLTAHNGMSKKLRNGQKGPERPYGFHIRPNLASSVFIDRVHDGIHCSDRRNSRNS